MTTSTRNIHRRTLTARRLAHVSWPLPWLLALLLVLGETIVAAVGVNSAVLAGIALLAPGLALMPLLPRAVRAVPLAAIAAAPTLGLAASSIVLISAARIGLPLTEVSVRVLLVGLIVAAWPAWAAGAPAAPPAADASPDSAAGNRRRGEILELVALAAVLIGATVLALRVVGTTPVPGNDWAKYLLYADEIRRQGSLLIDNPFWMLGVPFREDPGVPALYGSVLVMSGASAGVLAHGILAFTLIQILGVFAFARAFWGSAAGILAAALVAVVPATQGILGWHGLANVAAFGPLILLCAYLATLAAGDLDGRARIGAAVTLVGLAATHRLSLIVGLGATGLVILAALRTAGIRPTLRDVARVGGLVAAVGALVAWDLYARQRTFGGTQPYTAYLGTKIDGPLALRDISPFLAWGTVAALAVALVRHRGDRALLPPLALLLVTAALGYAWIVEIPNFYARMVYFVPLAAAPILAAVAVRLRPMRLVAAVMVIGIALTAASAHRQGPNVRSFYAFASPVSLRGLDAVAATLRPGEVVVTDRCWSFLATWLLHTRTLPALSLADIQPQAEVRLARRAHAVLNDTPGGQADAERLGVRYLIVDPQCPGPSGAALEPPLVGDPVFVSRRLAVLRLPVGPAR